MKNANYPLKKSVKCIRAFAFVLLLAAGCFFNADLFAQNRETQVDAAVDGTVAAASDPVDQYIYSHKQDPMVKYHLQNPADVNAAAIIKMTAIIENPAAFNNPEALDIKELKSRLHKMEVGFLETLKQNPDVKSQNELLIIKDISTKIETTTNERQVNNTISTGQLQQSPEINKKADPAINKADPAMKKADPEIDKANPAIRQRTPRK